MKLRFFFILFCMLPQIINAATYKKLEQWQTTNGSNVIFYPTMQVPMLNIVVAFAAGSAYDGPNFGLNALTTSLINQGSKDADAGQIAEKLADVGAQFESQTSRDMAVLQLKTLTKPETLTA